jgi:hypothetical protein
LPSIALQYYCNHSAARQGDYFFLSTIALTMTIVKEISVKVNIEKSNIKLSIPDFKENFITIGINIFYMSIILFFGYPICPGFK